MKIRNPDFENGTLIMGLFIIIPFILFIYLLRSSPSGRLLRFEENKITFLSKVGPIKYAKFIFKAEDFGSFKIEQDQKRYYILKLELIDGRLENIYRMPTLDKVKQMKTNLEEIFEKEQSNS